MKQNYKGTAYALLRITVGINFMCHGLVRLPKLAGFRHWMVTTFENSMLPIWSVYTWGSILPFLEFGIGILLIIGLFTYRASMAGAAVITILIAGSCLIEKFEWVSAQMIYVVCFYFLISQAENNTFALDSSTTK